MKRFMLTLIVCVMAMGAIYAQSGNVIPTRVVARRINSQGEITKEMPADFTYTTSGKPMRFAFPEFSITSSFSFSGDRLVSLSTYHEGGHPVFSDVYHYTYENGLLTASDHLWDAMEASEYWQYEYDELDRLTLIKTKSGYLQPFYTEYSYEYENDGRTVIERFLPSLPRQIAVYQYDEAFTLETVHTETYNDQGELTKTTLTTYAYTGSGKQEKEIVQTLTEGEWVNTSIMQYVYDEQDRVAERRDGSWDAELGDWDITRKITFEYSADETEYIVSFYKKVNGEWAWDMYNYQTILFKENLKAQQMAVSMMIHEVMSEPSRINQLAFTMEKIDGPEDTEANHEALCRVYPNPAQGNVKIESQSENCVVRFYDLQGRLMTAKPFGFSTSVNTESWQSGVYAWEVWHLGQKTASGKWVKE